MKFQSNNREIMEINGSFELFEIINMNDDDLHQYLVNKMLIRGNFRCKTRTCRRECVLKCRKDKPLGKIFYCNQCKRQYSILIGSFFEKSKIQIREQLHLFWNWANKMRSAISAEFIPVPKKSVIQIYRFLRDICSWYLLRRDDLFQLGGPGHVVQIDESLLTKRKYNRGRMVEERWVLGIFDTNTKKGFVRFIENRTRATLEKQIIDHVLPGSEIWTDCWRGYAFLDNLGGVSQYTHKTVNHSRNFVDPQTGTCTNQVEGYWSQLKMFLRRLGVMQSPFLPEYVDMFMWMQHYGHSAREAIFNITIHMSHRYYF